MPPKASAAISPPPMVGKATSPTTTRMTNIATGPMIGMKLSVAASAPRPAGLGMPVSAQTRPVAMPTPTLISVTVKR